jgi:hypothetical protein
MIPSEIFTIEDDEYLSAVEELLEYLKIHDDT